MESLEVSEGQSSNIHSSDVETTLWFFRPSILQLQNRDFSRLERKVNITEQQTRVEPFISPDDLAVAGTFLARQADIKAQHLS